jgi:RNA polymerase sigma factor (sigma-70 family)
MALRMPSTAPVPTPVFPGPGRASALPRDAGRATELLYTRHGGTVFRYAWHLLGRREDAEDATQATFLAVHSALAGGTAVLEPGAWVLGIARNECMGRLRKSSVRPVPDALADDAGPVAAGSVESQAAVRDEMRIARKTLSGLPEQEREAFVLREWLGLEIPEVALAMGVEAGYVEYLTARARRSLVLAVGGLEAPVGCAATRTALEAGTLDRAGKVHLLRCPVCRGVRRALRPRKSVLADPAPAVAERLAGILPGFGAGGGGIIAALTAKAATAPILTKAAALVAATLLAGGAVGQAIRTSHPAHHRSAGPATGRGGEAAALAAQASGSRHATLVFVAPVTPLRHRTTGALASALASPARGGAAERDGRSGSSGDGQGQGGDGRSSGSDGNGRGLISATGDGTGDGKGGNDGGSTNSSHSSGSDDGASATAGTTHGSGDGTGTGTRAFVSTTSTTGTKDTKSGSASGWDGSGDGSTPGTNDGGGGDGTASVAGTSGQDGGGATTTDGSGGTPVTTSSN